MLPVPYDTLLSQPYTYPMNNPPVVPNIQTHPEGAQLLITAAAMAANAVSESASASPVRTFCYNIISSNGWNNMEFFNLVRLVVDYTVYLKFTNSVSNLSVALQKTATELAQLTASAIAANCPEFFGMLDPTTAQRISQNVGIYQDYVAKADFVYTMQQQVQQPQTMPSALMMNRPQAHHGMVRPHNQPLHYPARGHAMIPNGGANPAVSGLVSTTAQRNSQDSFVQTKFASPARHGVKAQREVINNNQYNGEDMNPKTHAIAYRGHQVGETIVGSRPPVRPSVKSYAGQQSQQVKQPAASQPAEGLNLVNSLTFDQENGPVELIETSLAAALQSIEARTTAGMSIESFKITPFSALLLTPVFSNVAIPDTVKLLVNKNTFITVSEVFDELKHRIDTIGGYSESEQYYLKAWVKRFDALLTKHVNRYLLNAMLEDDTGFTVDSVLEDGPDILAYASKTYKTAANGALTQYQRAIFKNLFANVLQENGERSRPLPDFNEEPAAATDYLVLTTKALICHVSLNSEDFLPQFGNGPLIVSKTSNSNYFDMVAAIMDLGKKSDSTSTMLYTIDGVKYSIWECATKPGTFKIYAE